MVYLAAVDHYLQPRELTELMPRAREIEQEIKERFGVELRELLQRGQVGLVGEECRQDQDTIPRLLARENDCVYCQIDMPLDVRRRNGIPDDYERHDDETRRRVYRLREEFMVSSTLGAWDREVNALMVIGREHSRGISELLGARGIEYLERDFTLEEWFDPPFARLARGEWF